MSDDAFVDGFWPYRKETVNYRSIPDEGRDRAEIMAEIARMAGREDEMGDEGKVSGSLYSGDHEHYRYLGEVFSLYSHANVLQRDMYPSATKFEGEIVAMTLDMVNGGAAGGGACGVVTGGGSESLITAVFSYREHARETRGVTRPNLVMPVTAHVALDKGSHWMGVEVRHAEVADDFRVDMGSMADLVDDQTIAIVGSAGNYPHGLIDPIEELGELAQQRGVGFHVDGCLGGFLLPWIEELGYDVPVWDFRVPGVTSISADTHKYGYALKGTSTLLYRTRELRAHQYFTYPNWPGGLYLSPGLAGSRSGGLIASTWAALVTTGRERYLQSAKEIMEAAVTIRDGVEGIDGVDVIGRPLWLVAFRAADPDVDIYLVNDHLKTLGWRLNSLQLPPALHFCVTRPNAKPGVADGFVAALAESVAWARDHKGQPAESGAMYGFGGTPQGNQTLNQLMAGVLDAMHEVAPAGAEMSDADKWILGIDLGNGGPKVAVVGLGGDIRGTGFTPVSVEFGRDGTATQNADEWTAALRGAVAAALGAADADPDALHAVGITGQWGSTVPVGADGEPVGPVLLWADTRARQYSAQVIGGPVAVQGFALNKALPWVRVTGGAPNPNGADPTGHSLLLQNDLSEVGRMCTVLLEPVDYLAFRLTGRAVATPASMILSWLTDNRPDAELRYLDDLVRKARRDPKLLPQLVPTGTVQGTLQTEIAERLGLRDGVPVMTGIPDLHAAILGSGSVEPYGTHLAISTTAWLSARVPFKKTDIFHSITTMPGLDPHLPIVGNNIETGGAALSWLREQIIAPNDGLLGGGSGIGASGAAPLQYPPTFDELTGLAATVPAGSEGVIFAPWLAGERSPVEDKNLRATWLNLSLRTDRAMLVRSVLEGVALNIRWLFEYYQKFLGQPVSRLRALGGGAQSDLWCSIVASTLDVRVEQVADPLHAQLRGVALWARVCLGELTLQEAAQLVPVAQTFHPEPADRRVYAGHYKEYRKLYATVKGVYKRLNGARDELG